jgi:hypothetical protein
MANGIRSLELIDRSLEPASAEVWVHVEPEQAADGLELRGRMMGPRCRYSSTVEVAYPLRPLPRPPQGEPGLLARVVIPEASLWDPESPFYYEGPVELWQDGRRCDRRVVRHGLRQVRLGPHGLRWNGQPLTLRGRAEVELREDEAEELRRQGCNLLMVPEADAPAGFVDMGDEFGFLILGWIGAADHEAGHWREQLRVLEGLSDRYLAGPEEHPSFLGWIIDLPALRLPIIQRLLARGGPARIGVRLEKLPDAPLPAGLHFAVVAGEEAASYAGLGLPLLALWGDAGAAGGAVVLGTVG